MTAKINLAGRRFGRLVAVKDAGRDHRKQVLWLCRCDCGSTKTAIASRLLGGNVRSCGCLHADVLKDMATKHGLVRDQNTGKRARLYNAWKKMKQRCYNPNDPKYENYGGRGIAVCEEWVGDYKAFHDWAMGNGYRDDLTIDRINNDGNYEPGNCRWADSKTQANNRRQRRYLKKTNSGEVA